MKRIIQLLFVLFAFSASAQTVYPVFIQGCLIPNNGVNVVGIPVTLNFQGGGLSGTYTLYTNPNGCVGDSIFIPSSNGSLTVNVQDCNGTPLTATINIQNSTALNNFTINYCTNPTGVTCTAVASVSVQGINASFTGSAVGAGNFTYNWQIFYNGMTYSYNSQSFTQAIAQPGSYQYCLTVISSLGCTDTYCDTVVIGGSSGTCQAIPTTSIQGLTVDFNGNASGTGPFTYQWELYANGQALSYNSQNFSYTFPNNGVYNYCLTVSNNLGCTNMVCDSVVVMGSGCGVTITSSIQGSVATLTANPTGVAPFTYFWTTTGGTTQTIGTIFAGVYCVQIYDANGCFSMACDSISFTNPNPPLISGYITKNNLAANDAIVFLIEADSSNQGITLTAIDTTYSNSNGYYSFYAPVGVYHVKAALQTSDADYGSFLPTYYSNSASWAYSTAVYPTPIGSVVDINLIAGNFTGGPGFIGGLVSQGAGRPAGPGDPIPSVQVILFDNAMNALRTTFTDSQGNYEFASLPYGTYKVQVEMLGKPSDILTVTLDANNASNTGSIFEVNSTSINLTSVGIEDITNNKNVRIFPNPSNGNLNLQIEDFDQTFNLEVLELSGKTVMTKVISSANSTLNISELPNGIYFLTLSNSNSRMNFKIMKN